MSTAHYLMKLVHDILEALDNNQGGDINAAIATFYDWSKAFDMQCHKLGIDSFIECGVRSSLIPILVSYLQDRKMTVNYRSSSSSERTLPGGGAQGTLLGPIEYSCQSNKSANIVRPDRRYKFVDDLTTIEIISMATKIVSYNLHHHVPSDIGTHNQFLPTDETTTQNVVNNINDWTNKQKMKLNVTKTKYMVVNFTKNYQFNTRISLDGTVLDCIDQIRLLGIELKNDLTWRSNTESITKKAFARMSLLRKLAGFGVKLNDLVLYILFIRSLLDYCSVVWHSTITVEEINDLERVQKCAMRIILGKNYHSHENALVKLNLEKLKDRRQSLCLEFAKKCVNNPKTKNWFPKTPKNEHNLRKQEEFIVTYANNERFRMSSIPYLQRLLNDN